MSAPLISAGELSGLIRTGLPHLAGMGVEVETVEHGRVRVRLPFDPLFIRPGGTIAGSVLMALADLAMYGAVLSVAGPVALALTSSLNIQFLRRPPQAELAAEARLLKVGRSLVFGEIRVYSASAEEPVAFATCSYSLPPKRSGS
jgi:uncharacterized protein (TIGR00369 family)